QSDRPRKSIRVDIRPNNSQFLKIDLVGFNKNFFSDGTNTEEFNRPTAPRKFKCQLSCLRLAHTLDDNISADVRNVHNDIFYVALHRIKNKVGPQFSSNTPLLLEGFDENRVAGAGVLGKLQHNQTDRSASDDDDGVARADIGSVNSVNSTRNRLD